MLSNISQTNIDSFLGVTFYRPIRHIEYKNKINTYIVKAAILTKKYNKYFLGDEEAHVSCLRILFLYENENDCIEKCNELIKKLKRKKNEKYNNL